MLSCPLDQILPSLTARVCRALLAFTLDRLSAEAIAPLLLPIRPLPSLGVKDANLLLQMPAATSGELSKPLATIFQAFFRFAPFLSNACELHQ